MDLFRRVDDKITRFVEETNMTTLGNPRIVYGIAATILILATCGVTRAVEFVGGTGEPNDPYQIATAEQLAGIGEDRELLSKYYVLACGSECIGRLVGENHGLVHGCYTIVRVQGDGIVGGLVGLNDGDIRLIVVAGAPYGSGWVGGLAGCNDARTVLHSYWNADAGSVTNREPGTAKTLAELMSRETYEPESAPARGCWATAGTIRVCCGTKRNVKGNHKVIGRFL
jgi:hypothetical protein